MTTELLANLWRINQASVAGPIQKLTPETYRNRLTPDTASAGFIALHAAESMHGFARILFGRDMTIDAQTTRGVSDDGRVLDLLQVQQAVADAYAMIAEHIQQTSDEEWAEVISTPFGDTARMGVLAFLMHHNSYHAGQIAQATKKGKYFQSVPVNNSLSPNFLNTSNKEVITGLQKRACYSAFFYLSMRDAGNPACNVEGIL